MENEKQECSCCKYLHWEGGEGGGGAHTRIPLHNVHIILQMFKNAKPLFEGWRCENCYYFSGSSEFYVISSFETYPFQITPTTQQQKRPSLRKSTDSGLRIMKLKDYFESNSDFISNQKYENHYFILYVNKD